MAGANKQKKAAKAAKMKVGERRAAAKEANVSLSNFKQGNLGAKYQKPTPAPSPTPARQQAKALAQMSAKDRRDAAKSAGVSVKDMKAGNTGATPSNTFTTAAGYQMEKGAYKQSLLDGSAKRRAESQAKYKHGHNDYIYSNGLYADFDEDGYLEYDSTKAMWQDPEMLQKAGYKPGDMLYRPGTKDNLNGRTLTGRIGSMTDKGYFLPEYVGEEGINHQIYKAAPRNKTSSGSWWGN